MFGGLTETEIIKSDSEKLYNDINTPDYDEFLATENMLNRA